jgi:hypothetical protein
MDHETFIVIRRKEGFLVVAPGAGSTAEHADLNEAYRLAVSGAVGRSLGASTGEERWNPRSLMPFFIKSAVVAAVGAFLLGTAAVSFSYALHKTAKHTGQVAGRAVLHSFGEGLADAFKNETPQRQEKIKLVLRSAVPHLQPYMQELKPLFQ